MVRAPPRRPRRPPPGRAAPHRVHHLRLARPASIMGLLAVLGPRLLSGLSDDDPAGITTYSILDAEEEHALLWVIALSTAALLDPRARRADRGRHPGAATFFSGRSSRRWRSRRS